MARQLSMPIGVGKPLEGRWGGSYAALVTVHSHWRTLVEAGTSLWEAVAVVRDDHLS
ncbi:MAG: hypothetical protein ACPG4N_05335 [Gammaproteobacteria bacterium]